MICGSGDIMNEKRNKVILKDVLGPKGYIRGPFGSALKRGELLDKGIPVYEQQHAITESRTFRFYINDEKFESMKRFQVQENDLIISCSGTIGCVSIIGPDDPKGIISQALLILRANTDVVVPQYLKYFFTSKQGYNAIVSRSSGSVQVNIAKRELIEQIELDLPDIPTQKKIVGVLEALDEKINNNNAINDNLKQQALALYRSLFVDFDRVSSNDRVPSELGDIPYGWNIKTLAEVTTNIRTRVHNHSYKVLSALNSGCLQPSEEYFTKQVFSKDISNYIVVKENEFAYNPARVNIGSIGLNTLGYIGCVSPVYVVFRAESEYHYFMDFFIKSARFKEEVRIRSSGSVRQTMNYADFGLIKIVYPPLSAIRQFNEEYEIITKCINHNLEENAVLEQIRDSLIPKLMSGEIDISDIQV